MHVGMPVEEAPSALHAGDSSGDRRAGSRRRLEQVLDRFVGQSGEPGQPFPAAKERPQPPRQRDNHVAVGHRFKDLLRDELAKGRLPLCVTGGTKAALLIRARKQVLVAAIGTADAGEAMSQNPTALKALQDAGNHSPEGTEPRGVAVVVQCFLWAAPLALRASSNRCRGSQCSRNFHDLPRRERRLTGIAGWCSSKVEPLAKVLFTLRQAQGERTSP
jgi:hypothetical protein